MVEDGLPSGDDDETGLRPKTFLEKHGFKLALGAVAVLLFAAGLTFG